MMYRPDPIAEESALRSPGPFTSHPSAGTTTWNMESLQPQNDHLSSQSVEQFIKNLTRNLLETSDGYSSREIYEHDMLERVENETFFRYTCIFFFSVSYFFISSTELILCSFFLLHKYNVQVCDACCRSDWPELFFFFVAVINLCVLSANRVDLGFFIS